MITATIARMASMYATWGHEHYDEDVSQLSHALQCAALAANDGADENLIAAALLHDIGHLFEIERFSRPDHQSDLQHEQSGAKFLSEFFPASITAPIAMHVAAKRHLAATEPGYIKDLSEGSRRSLQVQGGPYSSRECADFLALPGSDNAIRLRRWDDKSKISDLETPTFADFIPLLNRVMTR